MYNEEVEKLLREAQGLYSDVISIIMGYTGDIRLSYHLVKNKNLSDEIKIWENNKEICDGCCLPKFRVMFNGCLDYCILCSPESYDPNDPSKGAPRTICCTCFYPLDDNGNCCYIECPDYDYV